ncbi:hypothetical protein DFH08DRAFT_855918 [Mycena albidolilacea]|uniref:Uncharacterized protein n=1 Tax=Mycena albidolilacea TaxID=1033008 RepID=A0AAD7A9S1_9AGAR|nr:hypothetical protein DFH08DRAFT_855918 [Mycena albidolilacea]
MSALDLQVPQGGPHPWEDELSNFVENLVICQLSEETTAQQLLALFDTPENLRIQGSEMFYYCACAELLSATRLYSEAGEHIALIAGLFGLLKAEGLKRDDPDDPDGTQTFMNVLVSPTVRQLADATAVPPGYKHNRGAFALEQDPEYVKSDSFQADLAEYARKHEGQLRFWSLVGRLDADGLLGSDAPGVGAMPLLFHQGPQLLRALEDPASRDVWETLWAAVLHCDEEMAYGQWGSHRLEWLAGFKDAARKIAGDARVSLLWRGRFAIMLEGLEKER